MTTTTNTAKVCDTCQKRLSIRNRADNGIQCQHCYATAQAELKAEQHAAAEAAALESRRNDKALLDLAAHIAYQYNYARERMADAAASLTKDAQRVTDAAAAGGHVYGTDYQTPFDVATNMAVAEAHASTLRALLNAMDRLEDMDAILADPFTYFYNARSANI